MLGSSRKTSRKKNNVLASMLRNGDSYTIGGKVNQDIDSSEKRCGTPNNPTSRYI